MNYKDPGRAMTKPEAETFFAMVMRDLGHMGWRIEWYKDDSREGYCWRTLKKIDLGPAAEDLKDLILHEIAHVDTCLNDNDKHGPDWLQRFQELRDRYYPGEAGR